MSDETAKLDVRVGCGQLDTRRLRRTFSNRAVIAAHKPADTGGTVAVSIKRERVARSRTIADCPGISACQHTAVSDRAAARDIAAEADIAVLPSGIFGDDCNISQDAPVIPEHTRIIGALALVYKGNPADRTAAAIVDRVKRVGFTLSDRFLLADIVKAGISRPSIGCIIDVQTLHVDAALGLFRIFFIIQAQGVQLARSSDPDERCRLTRFFGRQGAGKMWIIVVGRIVYHQWLIEIRRRIGGIDDFFGKRE